MYSDDDEVEFALEVTQVASTRLPSICHGQREPIAPFTGNQRSSSAMSNGRLRLPQIVKSHYDLKKKRLYVGLDNGVLAFWGLPSSNSVASGGIGPYISQRCLFVGQHAGPISAIATCSKSTGTLSRLGFVMSGSVDSKIRIWDYVGRVALDPAVCVQTLHGHTGTVTALVALGDHIVSGATDGTIKTWRVEEGRAALKLPWFELQTTIAPGGGWIRDLSCDFSHGVGDRGAVFAADESGSLIELRLRPQWDDRLQRLSESKLEIYVASRINKLHDRGVLAVRYVAAWQAVVTVGYDRCIRVYDLPSSVPGNFLGGGGGEDSNNNGCDGVGKGSTIPTPTTAMTATATGTNTATTTTTTTTITAIAAEGKEGLPIGRSGSSFSSHVNSGNSFSNKPHSSHPSNSNHQSLTSIHSLPDDPSTSSLSSHAVKIPRGLVIGGGGRGEKKEKEFDSGLLQGFLKNGFIGLNTEPLVSEDPVNKGLLSIDEISQLRLENGEAGEGEGNGGRGEGGERGGRAEGGGGDNVPSYIKDCNVTLRCSWKSELSALFRTLEVEGDLEEILACDSNGVLSIFSTKTGRLIATKNIYTRRRGGDGGGGGGGGNNNPFFGGSSGDGNSNSSGSNNNLPTLLGLSSGNGSHNSHSSTTNVGGGGGGSSKYSSNSTTGSGILNIFRIAEKHHYAVVTSTDVVIWHVDHDLPYNVNRGGHEGSVIGLYSCSGGVAGASGDQDYRIFSLGQDATIRIWDPYDMACLRVLEAEEAWSEMSSVTYFEGWNIVVTGHIDGMIRLWNLDTGTCQSLKQHLNSVVALETALLTRNDELLISAGYDGWVVLWDIRSLRGEEPHVVAKFRTYGRAIDYGRHDTVSDELIDAFGGGQRTPNGNLQDMAPNDGATFRGKMNNSGNIMNQSNSLLNGDNSAQEFDDFEVLTVKYDPYKKVLITGGRDKRIKVWSAKTFEYLGRHVGHTEAVTCLTLDSNFLFSGSEDASIRLWDTVPARSEMDSLTGLLGTEKGFEKGFERYDGVSGGKIDSNDSPFTLFPAGYGVENAGGHGDNAVGSASCDNGVNGGEGVVTTTITSTSITVTADDKSQVNARNNGTEALNGGISNPLDDDLDRGLNRSASFYSNRQYHHSATMAPSSLSLNTPLAHATAGVDTAALNAKHRVLRPFVSYPLKVLTGHTKCITGLQVLTLTGHLVSASLDGSVRVWDYATSQVLVSFKHPDFEFLSMTLRHDRPEIIIGTDKGDILRYILTNEILDKLESTEGGGNGGRRGAGTEGETSSALAALLNQSSGAGGGDGGGGGGGGGLGKAGRGGFSSSASFRDGEKGFARISSLQYRGSISGSLSFAGGGGMRRMSLAGNYSFGVGKGGGVSVTASEGSATALTPATVSTPGMNPEGNAGNIETNDKSNSNGNNNSEATANNQNNSSGNLDLFTRMSPSQSTNGIFPEFSSASSLTLRDTEKGARGGGSLTGNRISNNGFGNFALPRSVSPSSSPNPSSYLSTIGARVVGHNEFGIGAGGGGLSTNKVGTRRGSTTPGVSNSVGQSGLIKGSSNSNLILYNSNGNMVNDSAAITALSSFPGSGGGGGSGMLSAGDLVSGRNESGGLGSGRLGSGRGRAGGAEGVLVAAGGGMRGNVGNNKGTNVNGMANGTSNNSVTTLGNVGVLGNVANGDAKLKRPGVTLGKSILQRKG